MPLYNDPGADQLMEMLCPLVDRARKLVAQRERLPRYLAWPHIKADDQFIITADHRRLPSHHVISWQSTQSPPGPLRSRVVAQLLGVAPGDQLLIVPERLASILVINSSELKRVSLYWSGRLDGKIDIISPSNKTTVEDILAYLKLNPLPTASLGKG